MADTTADYVPPPPVDPEVLAGMVNQAVRAAVEAAVGELESRLASDVDGKVREAVEAALPTIDERAKSVLTGLLAKASQQ